MPERLPTGLEAHNPGPRGFWRVRLKTKLPARAKTSMRSVFSCRLAAAFRSRRRLCSASSSSEDASRRAATRATEFGFRTVPEQDKERLVGNVFHSVASKYDIMNDLMSVGLHRLWKNTMVEMIGLRGMGRSDLQVLDVAGGTGDVAFRIADQMGSPGQAPVSSGTEDEIQPEAPRVVVVDINKSMLETGRKRFATDQRVHPSRPHMDWVHASAEQLPFDDCSFDVYTVAFGIRNVTHIEDALSEVRWHPFRTRAGRAAPAAQARSCTPHPSITRPASPAGTQGAPPGRPVPLPRVQSRDAPSARQAVRAVLLPRDPASRGSGCG